ncbi:hypothetical protein HYE67_005121 [Fusarium culmorum]|uniref:MARVEL domain-containing protein n=1 Tax=Fusarium culmorum TaxID=5516 RepID=A0A7S8HW03_FUSCU|nr:hypothetical protein HYE67_005121 [Fusarium culmorum]
MAESGVAHKVISFVLRLSELAFAIIDLGILSRLTYLVGIAGDSVDRRIIYIIVIAFLGIIYSIIFYAPFKSLFLGFPFDFVIFMIWLVAYCLLQTVSRQAHTLALHVGTITIGVTIRVATGLIGLLELSLLTARVMPLGERCSPFHSSRGSSIF